MKTKSAYITTPIYYVNAAPHIGTAYTTIAADVYARFKRLLGYDVLFLTGTDEHGEKIQQAADLNKVTPQKYVDEISEQFKSYWKKLNLSFDDFIRTTEPRHTQVVTHFIKKAMESGDIYLGEYEGWYCVSDETFWTQGQLIDGKCPTCKKDVKKLKEENYFFKISKYQQKLLDHIEKNPEFIMPESKRNEVLSFVREGLKDLSVSRTTFTWGVPFPPGKSDKNHVVYVWFDALLNYVSALDPLGKSGKFEKFWESTVHLLGKDIIRFHAIYWPCFLMSVGLPLPKKLFAHGWWTVEGEKMSKSLGNVIDPVEFAEKYGLDPLRLFLFRELPFGADGDFSLAHFKERFNADLANNYGNLISRTTTLLTTNFNGQLLAPTADKDFQSVIDLLSKLGKEVESRIENFEFHLLLKDVFEVLLELNKYMNLTAPWSLVKVEAEKQRAHEVLSRVAATLRVVSLYLWPFIPSSCDETLSRLGQDSVAELIQRKVPPEKTFSFENLKLSQVKIGTPLFPRMK